METMLWIDQAADLLCTTSDSLRTLVRRHRGTVKELPAEKARHDCGRDMWRFDRGLLIEWAEKYWRTADGAVRIKEEALPSVLRPLMLTAAQRKCLIALTWLWRCDAEEALERILTVGAYRIAAMVGAAESER